MVERVSKEEFDRQVDINQRKELNSTLGKLATAISLPKEDKILADAVKESIKVSQAVADAIRNIPQPKTPDVNVQFNHKEFVTSMDKIADRIEAAINKGVEAQENKLMVDEFKIQNTDNWTKTAKVIYKKQSEITIKK